MFVCVCVCIHTHTHAYFHSPTQMQIQAASAFKCYIVANYNAIRIHYKTKVLQQTE